MVKIKANGKWLVLPDGFNPQMEHHNSALHPGKIIGVFAFNMNIPVKGNEETLQFSYAFEISNGYYAFDTEMWRHGRVYFGKLILTSAEMNKSEGMMEASFTGNGFPIDFETTKISDLTLPEFEFGDDQDERRAAAKAACLADESPFRFPVFQAPSFYTEEENPMLFMELDTLDFDNYKRQFINAYEPTSEEFAENFTDFDLLAWYPTPYYNLTTLVPFFHLLWVVQEVFKAIGWNASGSLFNDSAFKKILLCNNRCLYSKDKLFYARAGLAPLEVQEITEPSILRMPYDTVFQFEDDSEMINQDVTESFEEYKVLQPHSDWIGEPIQPSVGYITVFSKLRVKLSTTHENVKVELTLKTTDSAFSQMVDKIEPVEEDGFASFEFVHYYSIDESEINSVVYLVLEIVTKTPTNFEVDSTVTETDIEFFHSAHSQVNVHEAIIKTAEHVPQMTIKDLILDLKDLFCLDVDPDPIKKSILFNFAKEQLKTKPIRIDDYVKTDYRKTFPRTKSMRFSFGNLSLIDPEPINPITVDYSGDYPGKAAFGAIAFHPETRQYFIFERGKEETDRAYDWFAKGQLDTSQTVGSDTENQTVITPKLSPCKMWYETQFYWDHRKLIMPLVGTKGNIPGVSKELRPGPNELCIWHGMQATFSETTKFYPMASAFNHATNGSELGDFALEWKGEFGLYDRCWKEWADFLNNSGEFGIVIYAPKHVIDSIIKNKKISLKNQDFIYSEMSEEAIDEETIKATLIVKRIEPARN